MNLFKYKPDWIEVAADIKYVPSYEEKNIPDGHIIVATAWQTAPFVTEYSKQKGRKFYFFQHYERLWQDGCNDYDNSSYNLPLKKIVTADCLQQLLKEKFHKDSIKIHVPVDLNVFYPARERFNIQAKRICMLYHTSPYKGIQDGIKAFKIAAKEYPNIQLVMFGPRKMQNLSNVEYHYRPSNDELREIYNSCDIFLCPSWREGFGLTSAEAMACKCALVTADNGGSREYAFHEKTALVSEPKNPEALAGNLMRLLGDDNLLRKLGQNGYEYIQKFDWKTAVDKMENIFKQEL